jgi:hypothetical protein
LKSCEGGETGVEAVIGPFPPQTVERLAPGPQPILRKRPLRLLYPPEHDTMGSTTRTERAIDELDLLEQDDGEFEPSCDDMRLAWLASELSTGQEFEVVWAER